MSKESQRCLQEAYEELESELPDRLARAVGWVRAPERWWLRVTLGILCLVAGSLWFLPVVGLEFIPIGLLLLAQDIPFLQRPVARSILWLVQKYRDVRAWWRAKRAHRGQRSSVR